MPPAVPVLRETLLPLWARVLDVSSDEIEGSDDFFDIGGDSVAAIRFVTAAREAGVGISVQDLFRHSEFDQLLDHVAQSVEEVPRNPARSLHPFQLAGDAESVRVQVGTITGLSGSHVEDTYPVTAVQEALMVLSANKPKSYARTFRYSLPKDIDIARFKSAWSEVYQQAPILRTRQVYMHNMGSAQIVLHEDITWNECQTDKLDSVIQRSSPMTYGTPLSQFFLASGGDESCDATFAMVLHHSIYDGWCLSMLLNMVHQTYHMSATLETIAFPLFIDHIRSEDQSQHERFWTSYLQDCPAPHFPKPINSTSGSVGPRQILEESFKIPPSTRQKATTSTVLRTSLAVLIAQHENSDEVSFGVTLSGRNSSMANVASVLGPTVTTMPIRITIDPRQTVEDCLKQVQADATNMIPHEQYGIHRISHLSASAREACDFQTLLIVQPEPSNVDWRSLMKPIRVRRETDFYGNAVVLECFLHQDRIDLEIQYDTSVVSELRMSTFVDRLKHVVGQLWTAESNRTMGSLELCSDTDFEQIAMSAGPRPESVAALIHDQFRVEAGRFVGRTAIDAHDGAFTYEELDELSTNLALTLLPISQPGGNVLLCFEKSRWAAVATLAVLKAGRVCVPLHPYHPAARLEEIAADVGASIVLTSHLHQHTCPGLANQIVVVSESVCRASPGHSGAPVASCRPSDPAFIMYTSGSTGKPKGVVQTHENMCTELKSLGEAMNYNEESRVLQFAAYTFDVSIGDTFAALFRGACVCVPSEDQRSGSLAGYIEQANITHACLTPTVARVLVDSKLTTLRHLTLGGESLTREDFTAWSRKLELNNIYGVTECTIWSSFTRVRNEWAANPGTLAGRLSSRFWVVNPDSIHQLRPVGAVGELLIEGPTVAQGYWKDSTKTALAFSSSPHWMKRFDSNEKQYRVYRTGDLATMNEDGTVHLIGRRDNQVKLRGQRIELAEIESHIYRHITNSYEVVVDVIHPVTDAHKSPEILVAFIAPSSLAKGALLEQEPRSLDHTQPVLTAIAETLPQYMVPQAIIPLPAIPRTVTGKTDRVSLRRYGNRLSVDDLRTFNSTVDADDSILSVAEEQLRQTWASVLRVKSEDIGRIDNFTRLGGNSIDAMKLVAALRTVGLSLSATDVLRHPRLCDMALRLQDASEPDTKNTNIAPFSLLPAAVHQSVAIQKCSQVLQIAQENIEDILPCTPLQEGIVALSEKNPGTYTNDFFFDIDPSTDIGRFKSAWESVYSATECLRVRTIILPGSGLVQVVVKDKIVWADTVTTIRRVPLLRGSRLSQFAIGQGHEQGDVVTFCISLHHVIYDAHSLQLILRQVQTVYDGLEPVDLAPLSPFLEWTAGSAVRSGEYWFSQLDGYGGSSEFPPRSWRSVGDEPGFSKVHQSIFFQDTAITNKSAEFTLASQIKAAWAIVLARHLETEDVVFGVTSSGRTAPVKNIDRIAGPTIATAPFRVFLQRQTAISALLQTVQKQAIDMIDFEHFGIQNMKRLGQSAEMACDFGTLLLVQPEIESAEAFSTSTMELHKKSLMQNKDLGYKLVLECKLSGNEVDMELQFDREAVSSAQAAHLLGQFSHVLDQLHDSHNDKRVGEIDITSRSDIDQIMRWNSRVPEVATMCIHQALASVVSQRPHAQAVAAWDGDWTYSQLEEQSSNLAVELIRHGVASGQPVLLWFEKSRWVIVALLAICKAGGAFVPLDASTPRQRVETIISRTGAKLMLVSESLYAAAASLTDSVMIVSDSTTLSLPQQASPPSDIVSLQDLMYIIFTSGSTGEPKGVMIEHSAYMAAVLAERHAERRSPETRMLQFSSYSFDTCVEDILHTLFYGGCVCVPSEDERLDPGRLARAMLRMQVNTADLTMSMLHTLSPELLPELRLIICGGECMTQSALRKWSSSVSLMNAYGPSECGVTTHIAVGLTESSDPSNIGRGTGCLSWVVEPDNYHRLAPVGAVGELLIEGPILSRGYLGHAELTAQSFLQGLSWAADPERRFYVTGDLVRTQVDGTLTFVSRKDSQVKIRSQRVEMEEVEFHLKQNLPTGYNVVAEVIRPATVAGDANEEVVLAAFVALSGGLDVNLSHSDIAKATSSELAQITNGLQNRLRQVLPLYMVPSAFVPVEHLPKTTSAKFDRKKLRQFGARLRMEQLRSFRLSSEDKSPPTTEFEQRLCSLTSTVLSIPQETIGMNDSFISLGGDSITAMQLSALCLEMGYGLIVREILKSPTLGHLSISLEASSALESRTAKPQTPFYLLPTNQAKEDVFRRIKEYLRIGSEAVEDIYPCTPLQEGMIALTSQHHSRYVNRLSFAIQPQVDIARLKEAWEMVVDSSPILRTRCLASESGLMQVVLRGGIVWESTLVEEAGRDLIRGEPLSRFSISADRIFTWNIHHVLYDGWSLPFILRQVENAYKGHAILESPSFSTFVQYIQGQDPQESATYWRSQLDGVSIPTDFPPRAWAMQKPEAASEPISLRVVLPLPTMTKFTTATILKAAWAWTVAVYSGTNDVVFGLTLSGRTAPVVGIERILGPTITTVPIRTLVDRTKLVTEFLNMIQQQAIDMMPYEFYGLQNIRSLGDSQAAGCNFGSLLLIEGEADTTPESSLMTQQAAPPNQSMDIGYPVVVDCTPEGSVVHVECQVDTSRISAEQMEMVLDQFGHTIRQLVKYPDHHMDEVDLVNQYDRARIATWNPSLPTPIDQPYTQFFQNRVDQTPHREAIDAWDGKLSYRQLDRLSSQVATLLINTGKSFGPGTLVPLIFSKTYWFAVALMAVVKLGGAFVPLDPSTPLERLKEIFHQIDAQIVLVSQGLNKNVEGLSTLVCEVSEESGASHMTPTTGRRTASQEILYAIFTSGSTGKPKGVLTQDTAFLTCATAKIARIHRTDASRVLQFASHSFDTTVEDFLTTFICGGCVCIPSEDERLSSLAQFINEKAVNTADLTPSTMSLLEPSEVPTLRTLMLGGEALNTTSVANWSHLDLINVYGPTEASIVCIVKESVLPGDNPSVIGTGVGCNTWVVDSANHDKMMSVGATGELLIEGDILASGYLGNAEATAKAFITSPTWAPGRRFYKTGDLVQYTTSGTIVYQGRKDNQVKIRGQRVELLEVESHLGMLLPGLEVAVDIVSPADGSNTSETKILVAFVSAEVEASSFVDASVILKSDIETSESLNAALTGLRAILPTYMVPTVILSMSSLPKTVSSKLDRRCLRGMLEVHTSADIHRLSAVAKAAKREPESKEELMIQKIWSDLLRIPKVEIGVDDDFFVTGGNSISAIRLCAKVQEANYDLSVPDIFKNPTLATMARCCTMKRCVARGSSRSPFSLLSQEQKAAIFMKSGPVQAIEDAYPCSSLQEGLMALTAHHPEAYVTQFLYSLPKTLDLSRFKAAWESVIIDNAILRTRIQYVDNIGTVQIVVPAGPMGWNMAQSWEEHVEIPVKQAMNYGDSLMRLGLISLPDSDRSIFFLQLHHSLYDGWSLDILWEQVRSHYDVKLAQPISPYSNFITYLQESDPGLTRAFWMTQLSGECSGNFPAHDQDMASPNAVQELSLQLSATTNHRVTTSILIRAAWAIVVSRFLQTEDVVFGAVLTGRDAPVRGISEILGPVASTVPIRVHVQTQHSIAEYLSGLQKQATDMVFHQHTGLQNIKKYDSHLDMACKFQSLLIVQPEDQDESTWLEPVDAGLAKGYYTYPLVLECTLRKYGVSIEAVYNDNVLPPEQMKVVLEHFGHVLLQLADCSGADGARKLSDLDTLSPYEQSTILSWNKTEPKAVERCVHDIILEETKKAPEAQAIQGWDASFTYRELDAASTTVANYLQSLGVVPGDLIPSCFEKSAWAIVAVMGIIKAGAAFVPLEPSHPMARLIDIVEQADAKAVLVSPQTRAMWEDERNTKNTKIVDISEKFIAQHKSRKVLKLHSEVTPGDPLYVVFTSGSTGKPKGVINNHRAYCTSAMSRMSRMLRDNRSRVLQFASYSFDMSIDDILLTLMAGGCICVIADEDRIDGLSSAIQRMGINHAHLTPSFVETLAPSALEGLSVLCLLGEAMTTANVRTWASRLTLINTYGPSEAAVVTTVTSQVKNNADPANIGLALGSRVWIVDAGDHNVLAPVGAPGELLIEGPILARGYLKNEEKTNAAFVEDPAWMAHMASVFHNPSQRTRFYKTGDLVQYAKDGSIKFLGRKDDQVKLRGHRIELGEVEYHLNRVLPEYCEATAEIVTVAGGKKGATLTAFVANFSNANVSSTEPVGLLDVDLGKFNSKMGEIEDLLRSVLPIYMIPMAYIPVNRLPLTVSGKRDRKLLRQVAATISIADLMATASAGEEYQRTPQTPLELQLQMIWADVLQLDPVSISLAHSFLALGGDSLDAIKAAKKAEGYGLAVSVVDMFRSSSLGALVEILGARQLSYTKDYTAERFELLGQDAIVAALQSAHQSLGLSESMIKDIYPCTPLQEGLVTASLRDPSAYIGRFVFQIPTEVDMERLKEAWAEVFAANDILRTRMFYQHEDLLQAVVKENIEWEYAATENEYSPEISLFTGGRLCKFGIIESTPEQRFFVWTLHHAIYDAWMLDNIMRQVSASYSSTTVPKSHKFADFIKYLGDIELQNAKDYWCQYLEDSPSSVFPPQASTASSQDRGLVMSSSRLIQTKSRKTRTTLATVLRAAWAIVIAHNTGTDDVVFGMTLNGRNAAMPGISIIAGPTITTVPVRVTLDPSTQITTLLELLQTDAVATAPYEHIGVQHIQQFNADTERACKFRNILIVQSGVRGQEAYHDLMKMMEDDLDANFHVHPLVVVCTVDSDRVRIEIEYDKASINETHVKELSKQFQAVIQHLLEVDGTMTVGGICIDTLVVGKTLPELVLLPEQFTMVEKAIVKSLPADGEVVVDLIKLDETSTERLVAFFHLDLFPRWTSGPSVSLHASDPAGILGKISQETKRRVQMILPPHMVPSKFYPLERVPLLENGDVDKAELRLWAISAERLSLEESRSNIERSISGGGSDSGISVGSGSAMSEVEKRLRGIWADVLNVEEDSIRPDDNFFRLGGDSIGAMKVVRQARKEGIDIKVFEMFRNPVLSTLCSAARSTASETGSSVPGPMPDTPVVRVAKYLATPEARNHFTSSLDVELGAIEDLAPATDFQAWAVSAGVSRTRGFSNYVRTDFDRRVGTELVLEALNQLSSAHAILRTAFLPYHGSLYQAILRTGHSELHELMCSTPEELDHHTTQWVADDMAKPSLLGTGTLKACIIRCSGVKDRLIIALSHAQYDGTSLPGLMRDLNIMLEGGQRPPPRPSFAQFAERVREQSISEPALQYWRQLLPGSRMTNVVPSRSLGSEHILDDTVTRTIGFKPVLSDGTSFATVLQGAWSILLSRITALDDIVFGHMVAGRSAEIEDIAGPCINLIPTRVFLKDCCVSDLLSQLRSQYASSIMYETTGFNTIFGQCTDWPSSTRYSSIVQHQNLDTSFEQGDNVPPYKIIVADHDACDVWIVSMPQGDQTTIHFSFSRDNFPVPVAEALVDALCYVIASLTTHPSRSVKSLSNAMPFPECIRDWISRQNDQGTKKEFNGPSSQAPIHVTSSNEATQSVGDGVRDLLMKILPLIHHHIMSADNDGMSKVLENQNQYGKSVRHLEPQELRKRLALNFGDSSQGQDGVLRIIQETLDFSINTWDQGYMDKLSGSTNAVGVAAELILSVLNANVHVYKVSPVLSTIEQSVTKALATLFGLVGPYAGGMSQVGGSGANMTSLVIARNHIFPATKSQGMASAPSRLIVLANENGHYSLQKAAEVLGIGAEAVWKVQSDGRGRMMPVELERLILQAKADGCTPFYVCATSGTTVLGAFDPLDEIADICEKHRLWLHVDASWGGGFVFSPQLRWKLSGTSRANTVTFNPHKMLGAPITCSFLLARDMRIVQSANNIQAGYLYHDSGSREENEGGNDIGNLTLQCGRRGDAFKFALGWIQYGSTGYAQQVEGAWGVASLMTELVQEHEDMQLVSAYPPECLQVCFYWSPQRDTKRNTSITRDILGELQRSGHFLVDHAPGPVGSMFRVVVNINTTRLTITGLLARIEQVGRRHLIPATL